MAKYTEIITGMSVEKDSFSRPDNTTQYAVADLIANSATAGSVVAMTFPNSVGEVGKASMVRRARMTKDDDDLTAAVFRLHLFDADPVATDPQVGDNGTIVAALTDAYDNYLGFIDFDMVTAPDLHTDANVAIGVPAHGSEIISDGTYIYGLLEARGTYTPASEETFTVYLEIGSKN